MKKLIFLILCSLCAQCSCWAGSSVSVHVSVTIPPLPQVLAKKANDSASVNPSASTLTTQEKALRDGKRVLIETCVAK